MRILMLTCNNALQDGINRHILAIAPALNRMPRCQVAVCTTFASGEFNAELEKAGVKTYALGLPHGHSLRTWGRFRRVLHDFRPDVLHAHVIGLMERLYLGIACPRLPIVGTCHGITDYESGVRRRTFRDRVDALLNMVLPGKVRKTIYISHGVAIAKGCPEGLIAYNPVSFDEDEADRVTNVLKTELGLSADVPIIGTACRVAPPKKPHAFVRVMCEVLKSLPEAHAVVCGTSQDSILMRELKGMVEASGVVGRFHWLGYRKDAPQLTRELNCFVMTSATEGMPTALLEAMAVKTPIAFMRGKGGLVDLDELNEREGPFAVIADSEDYDGLAQGIVGMFQNTSMARRLAQRAFEVGIRHFTIERTCDQLISVYRSVSTR